MKIKTFTVMSSSKKLDEKVNEFLDSDIELVDIKFSNSANGLAVLIMYNENNEQNDLI
ncbi:hypothetical protein NQ095_08270 [Rossellomorea sp. SC111]|uniref:hypothetical protein n=1 Tax=Rossellomorea sp. SC111 TaxID=2968985 RepID=UPI00215AE29F|nr:hypothetical protein [Rossellomorea sp. SC111]MCR8848393.1 hypothetical protein [Rossellomorea sp. SC111]